MNFSSRKVYDNWLFFYSIWFCFLGHSSNQKIIWRIKFEIFSKPKFSNNYIYFIIFKDDYQQLINKFLSFSCQIYKIKNLEQFGSCFRKTADQWGLMCSRFHNITAVLQIINFKILYLPFFVSFRPIRLKCGITIMYRTDHDNVFISATFFTTVYLTNLKTFYSSLTFMK